MNHVLTASICVLISVSAARADDCLLVVCKPSGEQSENCTVPAIGLTAAMPSGVSITAVRGHTAIAPSDENAGYTRNCRKVSRLSAPASLDRGSVYGALEVTGTLRVGGVLRYEPNDGGDLEFHPNRALFKGTGPFFRRHFERLKLDQAKPQSTVRPPESLKTANCWVAKATIKATDFDVIVGDTSSAGTYVRQMNIANVHEFKQCEWGKQ